ncbi:IS30 family transposase [Weissella tructae]|uniref:IS30 family transposase n=2 Tax=Weissella TaxID=46255 RepID=A0A075TZZ3_9LACO|nr:MULTISPECIES: IS30 family transposase [Weissella]AIG65488.1 IS30 family transposase [Weissella tructae]AIM62802.1 IS30 family transposase [Weissella ceti]AIM64137.1 IS30 family transposase [Weissella ceti]ELA07053.1 transposase [Weissella ceti NC36]QVV91861.1 IS30 family transposase [Weissella tructae]
MAKRLTFEDRVRIETFIKMGENFSTIANQLGVSRAIISIEIDRSVSEHWPNKMKARLYDARRAEWLSIVRKERPRKEGVTTKLTKRRSEYIRDKIVNDKWSPEQIVQSTPRLGVCVDTIYRWINQGRIKGVRNTDLRHKGKRHKRAMSQRTWASLRTKSGEKRRTIKEHTIENRPDHIGERSRFGHWELDGVESKKSSTLLLTFVERKSRYAAAIKVASKHADDIRLGIDTFMSRYQDYVKSITCDRGSEFIAASTQQCFKDYNIKYYYAHAYAPYERGSNENFNALLREYFPKGTNFKDVTQEDISDAVTAINKRPMRLHRFKSRLSAFERHVKYKDRYRIV